MRLRLKRIRDGIVPDVRTPPWRQGPRSARKIRAFVNRVRRNAENRERRQQEARRREAQLADHRVRATIAQIAWQHSELSTDQIAEALGLSIEAVMKIDEEAQDRVSEEHQRAEAVRPEAS